MILIGVYNVIKIYYRNLMLYGNYMKYFVYSYYVIKDTDYVKIYYILSNIYFELYFYMKIN